jgi:hypothetical protein
MLSIGFFPLSSSLTTVNYLPYFKVVFRRNNQSCVPGAFQRRQRRAQPDEGVLFLTTFAARTMPYSTSKASKKQTWSGFACAMNNSHAQRAKRCVVGNWIPAPRKSGRIRSRRFVNGRSPNQIRPFGRAIRLPRRFFHPCFSKTRKKRSETTAFFAPQVLAHNLHLQSQE